MPTKIKPNKVTTAAEHAAKFREASKLVNFSIYEWQQMVAALKKPGRKIKQEMTPLKADCLHMGFGIASDGGEVLDVLKKFAIYNQELDRKHLIEELGDLEWFLEGLRQALGITRTECLEYNSRKLSVRYGKTYSDQAAKARKDKDKA